MFEYLGFKRLEAERRRYALYIAASLGLLALVALIGLILPRLDLSWSLLLLAGIMGIGLTLYLMERPELSLVFLLVGAFFVPLELSLSAAVSANFVIFFIPLITGLYVVKALRNRQVTVIRTRTMLPMVLFLVVAFISWMYGNANWDFHFPRPNGLVLIQAGQYGVFLLSFAAYFITAQQSPKVLRWITFAFIALGAVALVARYGGLITSPIQFLFSSSTANGSFFVWFTALAASQALFNQDLKSRWRKGMFIAAVLVPILGMLFSSAWTSSWLPPLIVLMILIWFRSPKMAILVAALLIIFVVTGLVFHFYNWEFERELSVGGRLTLWTSVWNLAKEQPILGLGLTTYRQYHLFIPLLTEHGAWYQPNVNSHNLYLDLFAQTGLIGLLVFLWIAAEIGAHALRLRRRFHGGFEAAYSSGAFAGLVGTLIASGIVEWMIPFVYNVGLPGLRFSIFIWVFLGGLVILDKHRNSAVEPAAE